MRSTELVLSEFVGSELVGERRETSELLHPGLEISELLLHPGPP
jgi:hypothetical protein